MKLPFYELRKKVLAKFVARNKNSAFLEKFLEKSGSMIKDHKWVFIVGSYNSGTTLLNEILSSHPQISGLPDEGVMLSNQLVRPEDFGWRRMWSECEELMMNSKVNEKIIKKHWSHFYDLNKPFLLEKSISNTTRLDFFNKKFQPAYFIHIVRNGYAVAEGIRRRAAIMKGNPHYGQPHYPIELCAKQWVSSLRKVEEERIHLKNFIEVRYEDLTAQPDKTINEILTYLNLENFQKNYFNQTFSIHGDNGKIKNMNEYSFENLSQNDLRKINEIAGETLGKYGYKILGE